MTQVSRKTFLNYIELTNLNNIFQQSYFLFSGGIGEGASLSIIPTYMSEVAAPEIRGTLGALIAIPFPVGAVFITLIGSYVDIQTMSIVCFVFPILLWSTFSFMPESPYYLLMRSRIKDASEALMILRRKRNVEKELSCLTADVNRQMSETGSYKDLFTISSNRSAFILVSLVRVFQQYTGVSAFMAYYQILIRQATNLSPVMGSVALLVIQIVMNWISYYFVDKLGRKVIMLTSATLTMLVLLTMAIFFTLKDYLDVDMTGLDWFPLAAMAVFVTTFSLGLGVVAAIFISEIYSASIKSKALGLGSVVFAVSMMSSTKLYQYFADHFSMAVPFYAFAFATFLNVLFTYFFLPETKGKTLEEIQQELKERRGWF